MARLIRMPEIAANATHAVLIEWKVKDGDTVAVGDCLAEIETDKAVVELVAEDAGVIGALMVAAGAEVPVGAPIAAMLDEGESKVDVSALPAGADVPMAAKPEPEPQLQSRSESGSESPSESGSESGSGSRSESGSGPVALPAMAPSTHIEPAPLAAGGSGVDARPAERIFASPLARRLAQNQGIDLAGVKGSGPNGRIVKYDVESRAAAARQPATMAQQASTATGHYDVIPHSAMRQTIARRLTLSKATIPHFYLNVECRMSALLALREQINHTAAHRISINDFIIKAAACALRDLPDMNVSWTDEALHRFHNVDISVAVSTNAGLITPIVRAAQDKSLSSISSTMASLVERARASQLRPDEYQGGAFGITNLGMYGVSDFSAIINPPQAAILAVGAIQKVPVVVGDAVQIETVMRCTLSVDHRAIDGAVAARWLALFKGFIENPIAILV